MDKIKELLGFRTPSIEDALGIPDRLKSVLGVGEELTTDLFMPPPPPTPKQSFKEKIGKLKDKILKKEPLT